VYFISASDEEGLIEAIAEHGSELRESFNEITRRRVTREMFRRGRQPEVEEQLIEDHGFAVNVQHDYVVVTDTTGFVWMRRVLTDTWRSLFVHYVEDADPAMLSSDWVLARRDSLTRQYVQGNLGGWVEIDRRRPLESREIDFLGRYGYEVRGLWQMVGENDAGESVQFGMGGPFVTYAFYDQDTNRIFMIDGMVFAPNFDKREFLRQMEVIAYSFRTADGTGEALASER
ncbi:MAG: DUF4837 family protein, partial [Bacteroidota bacterium]